MHKINVNKRVHYFILLKDSEAFENKHKVAVGQYIKKSNFLAGSLWQSKIHHIGSDKLLKIYSAEYDSNLHMKVNENNLGYLSPIQFKLLLALTTCSDRLMVFEKEIKKLKLTEFIRELSHQNHSLYIPIVLHENSITKLTGQLKFIGRNPERTGLWLGIHLDEQYAGKVFDNNSVIYKGQPLFPHIENHAVFANIAQISFPSDLEINLKKAISDVLFTSSHIPRNDNITNKIKRISSEYYDESMENCPILKNPYLMNRFNNDEDFAFIEDVIINRHYYTVPVLKNSSNIIDIKDNAFWKCQDKKDEVDIYSDNESKNQLTVPTIKGKNDLMISCQQIFGNDKKAWNSAENIKKVNQSPNIISRKFLDKNKSEENVSNLFIKENLENKLKNESYEKSLTNSSSSMHSSSSTDNTIIGHPLLDIGERVIWFTEAGMPELATVKWIGVLDKLPTQYTVGVEFDNPIGTGTGRYENRNLFFARNNHASLIPIMGLIKAADGQSLGPLQLKQQCSFFITTTKLESQLSIATTIAHTNLTHHSSSEPFESLITPIPSVIQEDPCDDSQVRWLPFNVSSNTLKSLSDVSIEFVDGAQKQLKIEDVDFELGMLVEVDISLGIHYGVIRWIGEIDKKQFLGIELELDCVACSDGRFNNKKYFDCPPRRGLFAHSSRVKKDSRFLESEYLLDQSSSLVFGSLDCRELTENQNHLKCEDLDELLQLLHNSHAKHRSSVIYNSLGINLGIQGYCNSCYLDSTLFAMFAFSASFDFILHRPILPSDIPKYQQVQIILRNSIVNPLRCNLYVKANMVLLLRNLLAEISSSSNFLDKERDPEELLNTLLIDILKIQPFLKLSSGYSGIFYQLIVEKTDINIPTTQQLLEMSLNQSQITFQEVPSILMLQMPRFGSAFKVYPQIIPSLTIQLQSLLTFDNSECIICGLESELQCVDCVTHFTNNDKVVNFCNECFNRQHMQERRKGHQSFLKTKTAKSDADLTLLHLFAVICIKTSHYVCFVRCGESDMAPWVFFDSMADRIGSSHGYNMPQVKPCEFIPACLFPDFDFSQQPFSLSDSSDKNLPEELRRLLCDGYICMYRSRTLQHYI